MANGSDSCYVPDGITNGQRSSPQMAPCDPAAAVSACCGANASCTGSGLCYAASGEIYRGGCTDKTFKDAACPIHCIDNDGGKNAGELAIIAIGRIRMLTM
jgi:hypothetical protein